MKKLLYLLAFLPFLLKAQKDTSKYTMYGEKYDSLTYISNFGNLTQVGLQKQVEYQSTHKTLAIFIGAKAIWFYQLALYLGRTYNVKWDANNDDYIKILAEQKAYSGNKPPAISAKALLNTKGDITSVSITGPADDLISLFVGYWEFSDISLNYLKSKHAVVKEFGGDKVSLTWENINPLITVTRNPHALDYSTLK